MKKICKAILTDEEVKALKGIYINESHITEAIIDMDTDCYIYDESKPDGVGDLLFKFRKNVLSNDHCKQAWEHYRKLAKPSRGRGFASGPIDPNATYWKDKELVNTKGVSTKYKVKGKDGVIKESKMRVNNSVYSQPIGYFESTKSLGVDLPCRLTHYTKTHLSDFEAGKDYIKAVDESYKNLNPEKHMLQLDRAKAKAEFQIDDTAFSTFTINRNFQTSVHKDAGDFGFGNLTVLEQGNYQGAYFCLPQYGIAIDLRQGDHLCVDVHQFHGNTKMIETQTDKLYNESLTEDIFKDNVKVGILGSDRNCQRISFVFYLRENIGIKCNAPTKFIINLDSQPEKMKIHKGSIRFPAVDGSKISLNVIKESKLYVRHNTKEDKVKGMYGCLQSHLSVLQNIVDNKINHVCILEDDTSSDFVISDELKESNNITYLGGWLVNKKMKDINKPVAEKGTLIKGINKLIDSRVLTTRAYYIPKWELASDLLEYINKKKVWKAIDIMLSEYVNHLVYPALSHQVLGYDSTIGNMKPKQKYEIY